MPDTPPTLDGTSERRAAFVGAEASLAPGWLASNGDVAQTGVRGCHRRPGAVRPGRATDIRLIRTRRMRDVNSKRLP